MAFETIYAYGLRRGELLNLKLQHIDTKRGMLSVINAKGKKDRSLPISKRWLEKVKSYYLTYKPEIYLIEGQHKGNSIAAASLQQVFENTLKKVILQNHIRFIVYDIVLPHICLKMELIYDIYRSFWDINHRKQQKYIPM